MRVFVTGATGWVGSAVVKDLLDAGHSVVGLARSDAGAEAVARAGATALRGDVTDFDLLRRAAEEADGVVHTAFNHDFSKFVENCENDRRSIEALGRGAGKDKPLLVTSGTAFVRPGALAAEDSPLTLTAKEFPRVATEEAANAAAEGAARVCLMRLPPTVHGDGDHGFVPRLVEIARAKGVSAYIGEGANRWPAVHRFDAARAYRLALENGMRAAKFHLVAEEGIATRAIAEAIGKGLGVPVVAKTPEEAGEHFGFLAAFFALDCPCSSAWTQHALSWTPRERGLLDDLAQGAYFGH
jgi:nucleoside-diphosphate-sugar epimerase